MSQLSRAKLFLKAHPKETVANCFMGEEYKRPVKALMDLIKEADGCMDELKALGLKKGAKKFTPPQIDVIVKYTWSPRVDTDGTIII